MENLRNLKRFRFLKSERPKRPEKPETMQRWLQAGRQFAPWHYRTHHLMTDDKGNLVTPSALAVISWTSMDTIVQRGPVIPGMISTALA